MSTTEGMHTFFARLATFQTPHQLSKRRASSQGTKKKGANTVEWPHTTPAPEDLARAGFFYKPGPDSLDNVQCFRCSVKLDGWEPEDDPIQEHFSHFSACHWATALSVARHEGQEPEARNPMTDQMVDARRATYEIGDGWVHEGKRGWKCKIAKMVDAGWCFDPSPENEDGVTCFYCDLSLDGWEPKDDPLEEHRRRSPECSFFTLCELYGCTPGAKGKGKGKGRTSTASKASRLSTQSVISGFSEAPSLASLGDIATTVDDSVMTTGTNASQATIKGSKKTTRTKAAAKSSKTKKQPQPTEDEENDDPLQTDGASQSRSKLTTTEEEVAEAPPPAKPARKDKRASKQVDSSTIENSQADLGPKKPTRGRKAKATQQQPEPAAEDIDVSAQLQDELDNSIIHNDLAIQPAATTSKRGVKRSSDGARKEQLTSAISLEVPVPSKAATKGKKEPTASRQPALLEVPKEIEAEEGDLSLVDFPWMAKGALGLETEQDEEAKAPPKAKKGPAKKGRPKKASSVRSSKATIVTAEDDEEDDLARDEREIEAELQRIAAEQAQAEKQAIQTEQEKTAEFEPSPSPRNSRQAQIPETMVYDDNEENREAIRTEAYTPSPTQSDKENVPSSVAPPSSKPQPVLFSPTTKTTRIPLAPGTPNRSPRKAALLSPSKHLSQLQTAYPWAAVDLDTAALLASPVTMTPGTLAKRLSSAAGNLSSPEKNMTVEEWIRWRAEQNEEVLRNKCEEMVGVFETQGMKALQSLTGIQTI